MTQETPPLNTEEQATVDRLLRCAYATLIDPSGEFMADMEHIQSPKTREKLYQTWLRMRPPQLVLFCRLMTSAHRLCEAGDFNQARAQVTQDLLMSPTDQINDLVRRVPEILELIAASIGNNIRLARMIFVLSQLLTESSHEEPAAE